MTIAVGLIANGGVVLAADTQMTDALSGKGQSGGMSLRLLKFSGGSVDYAICRSS